MSKTVEVSNSYLKLPQLFYSEAKAEEFPKPKGLLFNYELAKDLGLMVESHLADELFPGQFVPPLSGQSLIVGSRPVALAYAGHQFGHFNMLGDGRALILGEINNNNWSYDIQLKGSGKTVFSRGGDGLAALGPMLREYLISETMFALGVPTTRSLAVVATGASVYRDSELPGAILTRIALSHIRVGTFEFAAAYGTESDVKELADYAIQRHFPEFQNEADKYLLFLKNVCDRQAKLIALWMKYGFIHGVMNTDNMSISGETIDYGPCAFLENFSHQRVFSSIDRKGRYSYGNQPAIAQWNLTRLAETLIPLLSENEEQAIELAKNELINFKKAFESEWLFQFGLKFGFSEIKSGDKELMIEFLSLLEKEEIDFTNSFLHLSDDLDRTTMNTSEFLSWKKKWNERLKNESKPIQEIKIDMQKHNPFVIPRNEFVEKCLNEANQGDLTKFLKLLTVLRKPFNRNQSLEWQKPSDNQQNYKTFCGT